ncbi:exodeoxyribonuclease I [Nitrosomonas supralitoralis]|uniref:Exodeoxyribonuclease I n=1 Tax=Nitrosomonas supralitoralis TaxID=2116706 RepID=A0A2P7NT10_9PROT|nr:exodeoxyribonuclease I [Nitrosomonas supralitoralis]PSJ16607.1 exodeoxyribonuclease I [Nitrosomonas supralitoralis]
MAMTFYWHDYETFGADPRRDRPAQFAGVRTDEALNEIGEPLMIFCKPARDFLPHPEACLLTGITPQLADAQGQPEPEFIARIHAELAQPGTCGVGYNSLRFDDEVTRFALYRNFYDPYAREWQQGNSRWDIIDLVRMTYALRPAGITWPQHEDGQPSFKLEDLVAANGILHESAHDALSDVRATIGLARLIRMQQPRLYDWLLQLRDKRKAAAQLDQITHNPVLHTTRMYPAKTGCTSLVMPLITEPGNNNSVLVYDLRHDPEMFLPLNAVELSQLLFTRNDGLPEGMQRLPVKSIKINKCPALAPRNTLDNEAADRIALDLDACYQHWQILCAAPDFFQRVATAYTRRTFESAGDVDVALYDGFLDNADALLLAQIRRATPKQLAKMHFDFHDSRMPELLFRYRARNWPETLTQVESERWEQIRRQRFTQGNGGRSITLTEFLTQIALLREMYKADENTERILDELEAWGEIC